MVEQYTRTTLELLNQVRYWHWQTRSFAQHEALCKWYTNVAPLIDDLVEAWMGYDGRISVDQVGVQLADYDSVEQIEDAIKEHRTMTKSFKDGSAKGLGDVQDILDDIMKQDSTLLYLLTLN